MANNTELKLNVIKRDGTTKVPYDYKYIRTAIDKAVQSYNLINKNNEIILDENANSNIKEKIENSIITNMDISNRSINIEIIQDIVESTLMLMGLEPIAKHYILYRNKRNEIRTTTNQISDCIDEILNKSSNESNLKRDNANIDGNTAMGTMLQIGANSSKIYYLENMINKTASEHHKKGLIHIHDLDFYALTITCCQIDCLKLFHNGFCTGHGFLREPNSISSYAALAAIAIQSDQNDCHGGQSIPNFDYSMAPGIKKSFRKILVEELKNWLLYSHNIDIDDGDTFSDKLGDGKEVQLQLQYIDKYLDMFINDINSIGYNDRDKVKSRILARLDRECYQAMEGFVHNLNTMHSRAGAQVPFSSINLGTDTSLEGHMVTKNLLLAMNAGLGHGETAIFPIVVFKVKKGVNFNKEDPNYDLFKLSFEVTSKRLFPNYLFLDTPFNSKNYVEGDPKTEVATMGCVSGKETVTYKYTGSNTVYHSTIEKMWELVLSKSFLLDKTNIMRQGHSEYLDTYGYIEIFDSSLGTFVDCKKIIKNDSEYNKDKWMKLHFSNGKTLTCTNDHPLPVLQKNGDYKRTYVEDINVGDRIPTAYNLYSESENELLSSVLDLENDINIDTVSAKIINIEKLDNHIEDSYDVETSSDKFDVSGFISHNCRTRVVDNINGPSTTYGRGNLSFTSINLPRLAIISKDEKEFFEKLDYEMTVVEKQLLERFEIQCKRKVNNMPFLMGQGVWMDSDKLNPEDEVREVLKHGTLAIGFVGLAETMTQLYGHHHGEGDEYENKALDIIKFMRKRTDDMTLKHHLNFGLLATPAESLAGRFLEIDRKEFGIIPGVTDKDFYTNSFHIPVNFNITAFDKIRLEAPFHELTNGGHITYIELDGDTSNNVDVIEKIVRYMCECNIGYGSINHPVDRDPVCGYTGVINDECPNCHRHETYNDRFERIRRITGYLTGDVSKWNNGKKAEEKMRIKHGIK